MVPAVPLVPDLNIWPVLVGGLVAAATLGALVGIVEQFLSRRRDARSPGGEAKEALPSLRIERKADASAKEVRRRARNVLQHP